VTVVFVAANVSVTAASGRVGVPFLRADVTPKASASLVPRFPTRWQAQPFSASRRTQALLTR
jgi:hypothetical protein